MFLFGKKVKMTRAQKYWKNIVTKRWFRSRSPPLCEASVDFWALGVFCNWSGGAWSRRHNTCTTTALSSSVLLPSSQWWHCIKNKIAKLVRNLNIFLKRIWAAASQSAAAATDFSALIQMRNYLGDNMMGTFFPRHLYETKGFFFNKVVVNA